MPIIGDHGFSGSCAPGGGSEWIGRSHTFSYGIFEWVLKSSGKGFKKSAVKVRVSGPVSKEALVREHAEKIVKELNYGIYSGPKHVKI